MSVETIPYFKSKVMLMAYCGRRLHSLYDLHAQLRDSLLS